MKKTVLLLLLGVLAAVLSQPALGQPMGINLEGVPYPYPSQEFRLGEGPDAPQMSYMLVEPSGKKNGQTVVLLHGKNFNGAYWEQTASALSKAGYQVLIPDQVGFGKSSKPVTYGYTFPQLVENTRALLASLKLDKVVVVGHSMGGMQAMHWSLLHPDEISKLILVNPIGLEDWTAKGVAYRGYQGWYEGALKASPESIKAYQIASYYHGEWKPEYARWANLLAGPTLSPDHPRSAQVQALTTAMIMSEPVAHRFSEMGVPTTLILGSLDRTAIDRNLAPANLRDSLGRYDLLGPEVVSQLPQGTLIMLEGLGHLPQIEDFPRFQKALMQALGNDQ